MVMLVPPFLRRGWLSDGPTVGRWRRQHANLAAKSPKIHNQGLHLNLMHLANSFCWQMIDRRVRRFRPDEFRPAAESEWVTPGAPPRKESPNAGHHNLALVRQQPGGSGGVLHLRFPELVDRGTPPERRRRVG